VKRWYVVQTKTGAECTAAHYLAQQGFETFFPHFRRTIRHARQTKTVHAPLFPRYLFITLDLDRDRWRSVRTTIGVVSLVSYRDDTPMPVPVGVVEALMKDNSPVAGHRVRIMDGPFVDHIGTLDADGRVQVLLELMGKAIPATLSAPVIGENEHAANSFRN
jgi:transcription antitermination factor NusG